MIPVSNKRMRLENTGSFFSSPPNQYAEHKHILHHPIMHSAPNLYAGLPSTSNDGEKMDESYGLYASKFMPSFPNPAPEIDSKAASSSLGQVQFKNQDEEMQDMEHEPKKKKYAKETWYGPKKVPKAFGDI